MALYYCKHLSKLLLRTPQVRVHSRRLSCTYTRL